MDLRQRLKEETQSLQGKIDQTFLLKKILLQEITLSDYQQLIQKFYGFIAPCEVMIHLLPSKALIENRLKTPWLEQDLLSSLLLKTSVTSVPLCVDLPTLTDVGLLLHEYA